jgi:type I restriction-modification system DNA methylase subunit
MDQKEAKAKVAKLVERYEQVLKAGKVKKYSEEETKKEFILPLFKALGWDVDSKDEVSAEEHVKSSGLADYGFYINGRAKFYLEAKPFKADLYKEEYARQAIRYSFNKVVTWAVLTDFQNLKVFNASAISNHLGDKQFLDISYTDYLERFDELWLLSREAFEQDLIDVAATRAGKMLQKVSVTDKLYEDLNKCRVLLTKSLSDWNPKVPKDLIDEGVQKLLDRLIFIRVAEDRNVEPPTLKALIREWRNRGKDNEKHFYQLMVEKFRELDAIYDSNLFSKHPFEKWEEYDEATEKVINILYGKEGYYDYDFKYIPADVLGNIYENYLGYQLLKSEKGLTTSKDAKKRKEQGIYYTPTYIVDYIVTNALKPILDKCESVAELKQIRVLDPACGSGSFLLKAMEVIADKYEEFGYKGDELTKVMILTDNIYGVDLDEKAVEIAQLNLLINSLDTRMKLPNLAKNIKNGNSLISGTDQELQKAFGKDYRDKKPFNWQEEFPEVFNRKNPGFDVIIGNPPWGANIDIDSQYFAHKYPDSTKAHKDTYKIFIDLSIQKLRQGGLLGFIAPNTFLYQPRYQDIKDLLNRHDYMAVNLGEKIFNNVQLPCCILIAQKQDSGQRIVIDMTTVDRFHLPEAMKTIDKDSVTESGVAAANLIKETGTTFDDVFLLKDAGVQYASVGAGKAGKGKSDLPKRIFQDHQDQTFSAPFYAGSNIARGGWLIDNNVKSWFREDYKGILKENEWVHFAKQVFESPKKIVWRQTADNINAAIMNFKAYFGKTIHAALIKEDYTKKFSYEYALAIFNSKYIRYIYRQKVLETGKVFPQVKLKYLRDLPFVMGNEQQEKEITQKSRKMIKLRRELQNQAENSNQWHATKADIKKTNRRIDQLVYKLYDLTPEEVKIIES